MTSVAGKYDIVRRIAVGGMGEIFLARQSGLEGFDRLVILKTLLPDLAQDEEAVRSFLDEARIAATLNHPNIVGIYEVGIWDRLHFIAMEYISGETISGLLSAAHKTQQNLPPLVSARIIRDAAAGLAHAHEATAIDGTPLGIIHRDVSPQNIMVREDGVAKVVDFGIARAANRLARTSTGAVKGKVGYMAPEQLQGRELSARTDQYALGVVLWEMLAQKRRIERSDDPMRAIHTIVYNDIEPPGNHRRGIPPELDAIVQRMAARDPEQRYSDCKAVALALDEVIESQAESTRETDVAGVLATLAGDAVKARKENVTPSGQSFFLESSKSNAARVLSDAHGETETALVEQHRPRKSWMPAALALVVVLGTAGGLVWTFAPDLFNRVTSGPSAGEPSVETVAASPPVPLTATLVVDSVPEGATVRSGTLVLGTTPLSTTQLAPNARHVLEIDMKGYETETIAVDLGAGEQAPVRVELEALPPPKPRNRSAAKPQLAGDGFLTLETVPWTEVSIDGKPYGLTTLVRVKLPAGQHLLRMTNNGAGIDETRTVTISSGKTRKMKINLR